MPKQAKRSTKGVDRSNYTKAMMKPGDTSKGAPPELPTPGNKQRAKSRLPNKKIPAGMHQIYKEVPNHALVNKCEY